MAIKQTFVAVLLFFLTQGLYSQVGVSAFYNTNNYAGWNDFFRNDANLISNNDRIFSSSVGVTLDYWFRLRDQRIEFYPYISYQQASTDLQFANVDLGLRQIGGGINAHLYVLDLIGDCDCPTFSKQGTFFKKGFFLLAGIGADFSTKAVNGDFRDCYFDFTAHAGLGLDIGVTDIITLTPILRYRYYPDISWHELAPVFGLDTNNVSTSAGQLGIGLRVGVRLDYR